MPLSRLAVATATLALFAASLPASAYQINVGGIDYEVTFVDTSYSASTALLESQPWWGSATDAGTFATAVGDADNVGATIGGELSFAYGLGPPIPTSEGLFRYVDSAGVVSGNLGTGQGAVRSFATATAIVAVPEIDGAVLPQALFILFALGAGLHVRRNRLG